MFPRAQVAATSSSIPRRAASAAAAAVLGASVALGAPLVANVRKNDSCPIVLRLEKGLFDAMRWLLVRTSLFVVFPRVVARLELVDTMSRSTVVDPGSRRLGSSKAVRREQKLNALQSNTVSAFNNFLNNRRDPYLSAEVRLPPIDPDPDRCERAFVGNTIGQANAVSDRILDLRKCAYVGKDLSAKTLSGALMVDASFKGANLTEVVMSKAYAVDADFTGANFTNSVVDRVTFDGSNLTGADFTNAVITGTTYEKVNFTDATFENALIGKEDVKRLCENPTLQGESRLQVGCRD